MLLKKLPTWPGPCSQWLYLPLGTERESWSSSRCVKGGDDGGEDVGVGTCGSTMVTLGVCWLDVLMWRNLHAVPQQPVYLGFVLRMS